jgi:hypothetical protein
MVHHFSATSGQTTLSEKEEKGRNQLLVTGWILLCATILLLHTLPYLRGCWTSFLAFDLGTLAPIGLGLSLWCLFLWCTTICYVHVTVILMKSRIDTIYVLSTLGRMTASMAVCGGMVMGQTL